jgi:pimeloyl-ACP methyl ester carboxylesterase
MSLEGLAEAVHFMLQQEGIERCVLIGHSMGGYVALVFADRYEKLLNGFGLFHSTAFADNDEKKATRKKGIRFIQDHGAFNFLKTSIPNTYSPATKETTPALMEQQLEQARHFSNEVLIGYYEAMMQRPDRTDLLRTTNLPVLFIMGRHDTAVPLADSLAQCYLPQLAYIHVLERSGHMGMVEEPEQSNAFLYHFLSETSGEQ